MRPLRHYTGGIPISQSILLRTSMLQKLDSVVENYSKLICPFIMQSLQDGSESFHFCASDVLACAMTGAEVFDETANRSIRFLKSLDGALFMNNLGHKLGELKFNDQMNPQKQSRNSAFPVVCVCAQESKGLIKDMLQKVLLEMDEAAHKYNILPITLSTNCDMLWDWKLR